MCVMIVIVGYVCRSFKAGFIAELCWQSESFRDPLPAYSAGFQVSNHAWLLDIDTGDLNLGPHACTANTFT